MPFFPLFFRERVAFSFLCAAVNHYGFLAVFRLGKGFDECFHIVPVPNKAVFQTEGAEEVMRNFSVFLFQRIEETV